MVKRAFWLSITPEPERELPPIVATLLHGGRPAAPAVAREHARVQRLILRGRQRGWLAYLHEVVNLIERTGGTADAEQARARSRAATVIANHHNLLLALPDRAAARTAEDRARLPRLMHGVWPDTESPPARGAP